jgi:hypothetical protein
MITGLVAEDVPHDGACLFHALGAQLGVSGPKLRASLAQVMQRYPDIVVAGETLRNWMLWSEGQTILESPHAWGGAVEIMLVAHLFRRAVRVYLPTRGGSACKLLQEFNCSHAPSQLRRPLRVLLSGNHYMTLRVP